MPGCLNIKFFGRSVVVMALFLSLLGCSDSPSVKVGFVGSITGRHSELGVTARNTLQLLVDERNAEGGIGGRPVELVVVDDKSSPKAAKIAITELIDDGISLILGPITSSMAEATTEAIEGKNVLVMSPTMSTDYLADKDDNLLRTATSSTGQANKIAERVLSLGLNSTAVIYDLDNKKYTTSIAQRFEGLMKDAGRNTPIAISYSSSKNAHFNAIAQEIINSGADSALFATNGFDGAMLAQSLRKLGADGVKLFGVSWTQSNDIITHGGRAVEGMRLIALHDYEDVDPGIAALKKRYLARYNKEPSFIYTRYAGIFEIAAFAIEHEYENGPDAMKKAVLSKEKFNIMGRDIKFNRFGDVKESYNIVVIENGKFINDI